MNILRIIATADPQHGGPIQGLQLSTRLLETYGHQTEVVSIDSIDAKYLEDFPIRVHPQTPWFKRYGYTPELSKWIVRNAERFDVAVVHGLWNHASIGGWQGLRKSGLPYVLFTHGMMDPWFKNASPVKHIAKQLFWVMAQGKALRDAHAVLFTSEEERVLARGAFGGFPYNERVVAYGCDEPPEETDGTAFFSICPELRSRKYFLFLSRIHPKKGCDLLVAAFSKIAGMVDIDLVIAGPDQNGIKSDLQKLARKLGISHRIHWPGMLSGAAKWEAFRNAEAFVLPSHQENFGIVVAEAMSCSVPVLITDKVNIWREVEASRGGLVAPDNATGVETLLTRWLALKDVEKTDIRARARCCFERRFHIVSAARDLENALLSAVNKV